jgi:hypothetical protein
MNTYARYAQSISAYVAGYSSSVNMKAGIWSDISGTPDTLLATSQEISVGTTPGWVTFPISYVLVALGLIGLVSFQAAHTRIIMTLGHIIKKL